MQDTEALLCAGATSMNAAVKESLELWLLMSVNACAGRAGI
jgi:hypothetical protein